MADSESLRALPMSSGEDLLRLAASGVGWSLAAATAARGFAVFAALAAASILGPDAFGRVVTGQSTLGLFATAAGLGLGTAVSRRIAVTRRDDPRAAAEAASFGVCVTLALGALLAALLFLTGSLAADIFSVPHFEIELRRGVGIVIFSASSATAIAALTAFGSFRFVFLATAASAFFDAALLAVGALSGGSGGALLGLSLAELVGFVLALVLLQHVLSSQGTRLTLQLHIPLETAGIAGSAFVAGIWIQASLWAANLLLVRAGGTEEASYFALAYRWHLVSMFVPAAVAPIALPILTSAATASNSSFRRILRFALFAAPASVLLPVAAILLLAPWLATLTGLTYGPAASAISILALAAFPSALNNVLSVAALSRRKVTAWLLSDLTLGAAVLGTALISVPSFGAAGLAFAYLAGMALTCLVLAGPVLGVRVPRRGVRTRFG